jgi:hypothetical protein
MSSKSFIFILLNFDAKLLTFILFQNIILHNLKKEF